VRALSAGYDALPVLREVDLDVRPGELWAVLGPNGAGKSTLLKACVGLCPVTGGEVRLFDRPLASWTRRAIAQRVAVVPQSSEEVEFTGLELVLLGKSPHRGLWGLSDGRDVDEAMALLSRLDLSSLAARRACDVSGGERRMLAFARALMQRPELLLLDEPTAFLDLRHQALLLTAVRERCRAGLAAVAVLHDVNLAAAFADHVLLLREGRVLAQGAVGAVLAQERLEALYGLPMVVGDAAGQRLFGPKL
jgi:iron complex transport system ATP-binding protein